MPYKRTGVLRMLHLGFLSLAQHGLFNGWLMLTEAYKIKCKVFSSIWCFPPALTLSGRPTL